MKRYKKEFELKYFVDVKTCPDGKVIFQFGADCGKFGTDEMLDEYEFTAKELLSILQRHDAGGRSEQLCRTFLSDGTATSATQCRFCGKEKWEHPKAT